MSSWGVAFVMRGNTRAIRLGFVEISTNSFIDYFLSTASSWLLFCEDDDRAANLFDIVIPAKNLFPVEVDDWIALASRLLTSERFMFHDLFPFSSTAADSNAAFNVFSMMTAMVPSLLLR